MLPKRSSRSAWLRYGVAIGAVAVAVAGRQIFDPLIGDLFPFATLFLAVLFGAWQGGFGPGLVATLVGGALTVRFLLPWHGWRAVDAEHQVGLLLYFAVGGGIAVLGEAMRGATARAERLAFDAARRDEQIRTTLASVGDGVIVTDADGVVVAFNSVAESLTGWRAVDAVGRRLEHVFRIENERTGDSATEPLARSLKVGEVVKPREWTVLIGKAGGKCPIENRAAPIRNEGGEVGGGVLVFRDVSEQRRAARELQESEERFRLMANTAPVLIWMAGPDRRRIFFNQPWLDFTGRTFEQECGDGWTEGIDPEDRGRCLSALETAFASHGPFQTEYRLRRADGEYRWLLDSGVPRCAYDGEFDGYIGSCIDVTDRKRLEQELRDRVARMAEDITERRRAEMRNRFLADASATLAELVDYESTLQKVSGLAVPSFADWCVIDMLEADGSLRRLAVNHVDPARAAAVADLRDKYAPNPDAPLGVWSVVRSGKSELISDFSEKLFRERVTDGRLREILATLGLKSLMAVPFSVRGKIIGVITFVVADSSRAYGAPDLAVAEELAHRAAIAVDNARLYQALREADRRKDEFLAMLAHELRNPLAPVRSALQILRQPDADPVTVQEARDIADRQMEHLTRLVDDLLDVARIMRGRIELRREPAELAAIVTRAVETVQPIIQAQGHRLTVSLPDEPVRIHVDPVRISQVLANLLNNAARYTPPGGRIELSASRSGDALVLSVRDSGIGIAPDQLPQVFDMFMQAAPGDPRSKGGLGIGLTLVKTLVELHGGTVVARSPGVGQGTEIVVRLPHVESPAVPPAPPARDGANGDPSHESRRLMVVDDNEDAANSLSMLLRLKGHEVRVLHGGEAALEAVREKSPEVVLLDLGMPGIDGYETARRMRTLPGGDRIVLVALTGWGQEQDRRRSHEAGFDQHLTKPVDPRSLDAVLRLRRHNV